MTQPLFNTLKYVKLLREAGFNQQQAEGLNEATMEAIQVALSQVATQVDLRQLRADIHIEIQSVRAELKAEIQSVRAELKAEIQEVRAEIQAVRAELKAEMQELRAEIRATEHRLEQKIADIKPFVYKALMATVVANFAMISSALAIFKFIA
jgi:predicted  nucleic acid-binding Zn-ribbon protein